MIKIIDPTFFGSILPQAEECKLKLPEDAEKALDSSFVFDFNQRISEALEARIPQWTEQLDRIIGQNALNGSNGLDVVSYYVIQTDITDDIT